MIELKLPMNIVYELVLTNSKRLYNGPYDFFYTSKNSTFYPLTNTYRYSSDSYS